MLNNLFGPMRSRFHASAVPVTPLAPFLFDASTAPDVLTAFDNPSSETLLDLHQRYAHWHFNASGADYHFHDPRQEGAVAQLWAHPEGGAVSILVKNGANGAFDIELAEHIPAIVIFPGNHAIGPALRVYNAVDPGGPEYAQAWAENRAAPGFGLIWFTAGDARAFGTTVVFSAAEAAARFDHVRAHHAGTCRQCGPQLRYER